MNKVYAYIKEELRKKNITQDAVATALDVSRQTVNNRLKEASVDLNFVKDVKTHFGIDVPNSLIFDGETVVSSVTPPGEKHGVKGNNRFLDFYHNLPTVKPRRESLVLPCYDIPFAAGAGDMIRDVLEVPEFYVMVPRDEFPAAKKVFRVYGDSMEKKIPDKAWAICADDIFPDFKKNFEGGSVYAIVFKTNRYLLKNVLPTKNSKKVRTESVNTYYTPKEYDLSEIRCMYPYLGWFQFERQQY